MLSIVSLALQIILKTLCATNSACDRRNAETLHTLAMTKRMGFSVSDSGSQRPVHKADSNGIRPTRCLRNRRVYISHSLLNHVVSPLPILAVSVHSVDPTFRRGTLYFFERIEALHSRTRRSIPARFPLDSHPIHDLAAHDCHNDLRIKYLAW